MICVEEALSKIDQSVCLTDIIALPVVDSVGRVLAEDVRSKIDMPPFNQSAMDGYAVNFTSKIREYNVISSVAAGDKYKNLSIAPGEAIRVYTGAPVPSGANRVIRQEDAIIIADKVTFSDVPKEMSNIRLQGEQKEKGMLALTKGTVINPGALGFLLSLGVFEVKVFRLPKIMVLVTGNELVNPGEKLEEGKVYESNSSMLLSALYSSGYPDAIYQKITDDFELTLSAIRDGIGACDLLLISGGISVGDYDFVGKALAELEVTELFYKVKQQPGKPLYFGKKHNCFVLALPGNPAAALTNFYIYALRLLRKMGGRTKGLEEKKLPISATYQKKNTRAQFLRAQIKNDEVELLSGQSSAMLEAFSNANCIAYIPEECHTLLKGDLVLAFALPVV